MPMVDGDSMEDLMEGHGGMPVCIDVFRPLSHAQIPHAQ